jgi:hypothetical protein
MATGQQPIIDAIFAALTAATAFSAAVTGIYDTFAGVNPTLPVAVFTIITDEVQHYFGLHDDILCDFQLDIYGPMDTSIGGPKATRAIGDLAYAALDRQAITITGYAGCSILCQSRTPGLDTEYMDEGSSSQDAYRDSRTYRIFGTGTA